MPQNQKINKSNNQFFILIDENNFLNNKKAKEIIDNLLKNEDETLCLEIINGTTNNIKDTIDCINKSLASLLTPSFSKSKLKIVFIKNASFLAPPLISYQEVKNSLSLIIETIKKIPRSSFLIITSNTIDERTSFYKEIEKYAEITNFATTKPEPLENKAYEYLSNIIKKHNLKASNDIIQLIIEKVGPHLNLLENEIEKIATYLLNTTNKNITLDILETLVPSYKQNNIWDFLNKLCSKKLTLAIHSLKQLLFQQEDPIAILSIIDRHFRQLMILKNAIETKKIKIIPKTLTSKESFPIIVENNNKQYLNDLLEVLSGEKGKNISNYAIRKLAEETANFSTTEIKKIIDKILKARQDIVSSNIPPTIILENLTISICLSKYN